MSKITQNNLKDGIRKTEIHGRHKYEQYHINTPTKHLKYMDQNKVGRIDQRKVEEGEYLANNTDMRGKQDSTEFRGHQAVRWMPEKDFQESTSGYADGGAFNGGESGNEKGSKGDYSQSFGTVGKKSESANKLNPFAIKISKSVKFKI